jgi:toxin-antitoxin system PIN domain toxin
MTLFFPDLNVWLALSITGHTHNAEAWRWFEMLPEDGRLVFSRYTQIGLLRLLTNSSAMAGETLTLQKAWDVYEHWLGDPRIELYPEPRGVDEAFRQATAPFDAQPASKWVGDCYILAFAKQTSAILVTFDRALLNVARMHAYPAISPA